MNIHNILNLPLLFNASESPRDENTINVGANRHIANMFRTKDVVTLEEMKALNKCALDDESKSYVQVVVL